jgi:hypothetical protein
MEGEKITHCKKEDFPDRLYLLVPLGIDIKSCTKDIAARTIQAEPPFFFANT